MAPPKKILLVHKRAPGDTLVLTGLIRDIALTYPGQFQIGFKGSAEDLLRHNPYLTRWSESERRRDTDFFEISYGQGLKDQNRETVHFMPYFHRVFNKKYGTDVKVHFPYPDLHFGPDEEPRLIEGRYWVLLSGGKSDFTAKVWETSKFQQVVDTLRSWGIPVVQVGGTDKGHWHPDVAGTLDLVGKTNLRDLMRIVRDADGVVCGVTCCMHLAAALQRPCVVLAGGREAWWWEYYGPENRGLVCPEKIKVPHRFLHTIGLLPCCAHRGCWRSKVTPLNGDKSICKDVVTTRTQVVPRCMDMITPEMVTNAVLSYYLDATLPPIPGTHTEEAVLHLQEAEVDQPLRPVL